LQPPKAQIHHIKAISPYSKYYPKTMQTPTSGRKANAMELITKSPDELNDVGTGGAKIVAEWQGKGNVAMEGASHAIWLD
jgi:hypothetical protein